MIEVAPSFDIVWAQDLSPPRMGMLEAPLVKMPPGVADWHVTYVPDYEGMVSSLSLSLLCRVLFLGVACACGGSKKCLSESKKKGEGAAYVLMTGFVACVFPVNTAKGYDDENSAISNPSNGRRI